MSCTSAFGSRDLRGFDQTVNFVVIFLLINTVNSQLKTFFERKRKCLFIFLLKLNGIYELTDLQQPEFPFGFFV